MLLSLGGRVAAASCLVSEGRFLTCCSRRPNLRGGKKIDLVLTDINMPVMDGLKLLSLMKDNPAYREIPVVMVTTEGGEDARRQGMALGAFDYVTKPVQTGDLLRVVRRALSAP